MEHHTDQAIQTSLQKLFGGLVALPQAELRRRLLSTPEFAYFADQMIERALAADVLVRETGEMGEVLRLVERPDFGKPPF